MRALLTAGATRSALALLVLGAIPAVALAQWLDYPTPGIPRTASGEPDLKAPVPLTREGKPDFSGIWFANVPAKDYCKEKDCVQEERMAREQINLGIKLPDGLPYTEWSKEQMVTRRANGGRDDPHTYCKPPNFPRAWTLPQYIKIVQTPGEMVMLHEFNAAYRDVFLDGRPLPEDPDPFFNGHSVGRWEGDTLVVDTVGLSPMVSVVPGLHATEATRFRERITRTAPDRMVDEITVTDPTLFAEPYVMVQNYHLEPDWEMREYVCQENNRDAADAQGRPTLDLGEDDPFAGPNN